MNCKNPQPPIPAGFRCRLGAALAALVLLGQPAGASAEPVGTGFTYQGHLTDKGLPANGLYDFRFSLWDSAELGARIGETLQLGPIGVTNGLFTVELDYGAGVFGGDERWLEVAVRRNGTEEAFALLSPRQKITPVPLATFALTARQAQQAQTIVDGRATNLVVVGATVQGLTNVDLTEGRVVMAGQGGRLQNARVTEGELATLSGIKGSVQGQLDRNLRSTNGTATNLQLAGQPRLLAAEAGRVAVVDASQVLTSSGLGAAQLNHLADVRASIQAQLDALASQQAQPITALTNVQATNLTIVGAVVTGLTNLDLTEGRVVMAGPGGRLQNAGVTEGELGLLSGVRAPVQSQLDQLADVRGSIQAQLDALATQQARPITMLANVHATNLTIVGAVLSGVTNLDLGEGRVVVSGPGGKLQSADIGQDELRSLAGIRDSIQGQLDRVVRAADGTAQNLQLAGQPRVLGAEAGKVAVLDANQVLTSSRVGAAQLDHLADVRASIQAQLDALAIRQAQPITALTNVQATNLTIVGAVVTGLTNADLIEGRLVMAGPGGRMQSADLSPEEVGALSGIRSPIQVQLDQKLPSVGGTAADLGLAGQARLLGADPDRVVVLDANRALTTGPVTSGEVGYLSGLRTSVQAQLDAISAQQAQQAQVVADTLATNLAGFQPIVIEASDDGLTWVAIYTLRPTESPAVFIDRRALNGNYRYYRARFDATAGITRVTLNNMADLRVLTGGAATLDVSVRGYSTPADGGGGEFYWDAESTETADGGIVIKTVAAPERGRWRRVFSGAVNVLWFGARGNGIADDTQALQAAAAALQSRGGGTLSIPPGIYITTNTIVVGSATTVAGAGAASSILRALWPSHFQGARVDGAELYATLGAVGAKGITVRDLTVDNSRSPYTANGIAFVPAGANYDGAPCTDCAVERCRVLGFDKHQYLIWSLRGRHIRIVGNHCIGNSDLRSPSSQEGIEAFGGHDVAIINNTVEYVGNAAINIASSPGVPNADATDIHVSGNTIQGARTGINLQVTSGASEISPQLLDRCTISHNIVLSATAQAVHLQTYAGGTISNTKVEGNIMANCTKGLEFDNWAYPESTFDSVTVSENLVVGSTSTNSGAISLFFSDNIRLAHNVITSNAYQAINMYGCTNISIVGNQVDRTAGTLLYVDKSESVYIVGNEFRNYNALGGRQGIAFFGVRSAVVQRNSFEQSGESYAVTSGADCSRIQVLDNLLLYQSTLISPFSMYAKDSTPGLVALTPGATSTTVTNVLSDTAKRVRVFQVSGVTLPYSVRQSLGFFTINLAAPAAGGEIFSFTIEP